MISENASDQRRFHCEMNGNIAIVASEDHRTYSARFHVYISDKVAGCGKTCVGTRSLHCCRAKCKEHPGDTKGYAYFFTVFRNDDLFMTT